MSTSILDPLSDIDLESYGIGERVQAQYVLAFTDTDLSDRVLAIFELSLMLQSEQRNRLVTDVRAAVEKAINN